ncbi:MAG: hypothetical protein DSZ24_04210 [Thermodesulfatator sp.]|nr:MAG: hypothetical protein DSZ24_04210 [Thermodesulfatator sp.]
MVVDGGNRAKRWREVKDLAQTFEGRIHLHHPDWTPDEVEIRRFDLKKDLDPYEIARVVVKVAEEL